jgi:hypothetical protein
VASGLNSLGRAAIAVASASLLLLGACSRPQVGVDVGIVYRGGPAPGNSNVLRQGTIKVLTADGALQTSGRVQDGHALHVSLPPGNYRIEARSGDAQCVSRGLTVRAGANASLHVSCSVR